jgi:WD40 repeat protein
MLDGSDSGEINALAITKDGENFVSGGEDKKIKVWNYDEGISYFVGHGHSGSITRVSYFIYNSIDCHFTRSEIYCQCWNRRSHLLLAHS